MKLYLGFASGVVLSGLVQAGCVAVTPATPSATTPGVTSGGRTDGQVEMPDLFLQTHEQATAALRRAGHAGTISRDDNLCGSVVEGRVVAIGQICYQTPAPGRTIGARSPISIRVQTEDPWHGNAGKVTEWRLMPALVGKKVEDARATMQKVGFTRDDRVAIQWVDEPGCAPLTVCKTYPEALQRVGIASSKLIYAGRDPNAKPVEPTPPPDAERSPPAASSSEPFF